MAEYFPHKIVGRAKIGRFFKVKEKIQNFKSVEWSYLIFLYMGEE